MTISLADGKSYNPYRKESSLVFMEKTSLYDEHVAEGGRMVDFAGWLMPVQYEGVVAEHLAVRTASGR
ncbi:MAG TPA: hypothetical protein VI874_04180, partial [Candidatus Norongarragalinales archaeon]|nr:hypothetical protein [Candidatus Norongarragalinales archaeon]